MIFSLVKTYTQLNTSNERIKEISKGYDNTVNDNQASGSDSEYYTDEDHYATKMVKALGDFRGKFYTNLLDRYKHAVSKRSIFY